MLQAQVCLVGAGPGDPGLITVRGLERLRRADVVVYDRLIDPMILREARADVELIDVGKCSSHHALPQFAINSILIDRARCGKLVVRLAYGDPFAFGHGAEEALSLAQAKIPFEIIPGIPAAIAVPESAGIPVTCQETTTVVTLVCDDENAERDHDGVDWAALAGCRGTLVFLMSVARLATVIKQLVENGRPLDTPAAVIECGPAPQPRVVVGTLSDIHERADAAQMPPDAVIVVGEVVTLQERLRAIPVE